MAWISASARKWRNPSSGDDGGLNEAEAGAWAVSPLIWGLLLGPVFLRFVLSSFTASYFEQCGLFALGGHLQLRPLSHIRDPNHVDKNPTETCG